MFQYLIAISLFFHINCWPNFELYTRNNVDKKVLINSQNLTYSHFSHDRETKFLIHGFTGGSLSLIKIKTELLKAEDLNVIVVEWADGARPPNYFAAAGNTRIVAEKTAKFITENQISNSKVHCIGHSLGAHTCGFIGKIEHLARISGLDPAGPLFGGKPADSRLDKTDADLVDVIHTDSELGIQESIGHLNFYPNGGRKQNGCIFRTSDLLTPIINNKKFELIEMRIEPKGDVGGFLSCSHGKVNEFYAESISSCHFKSAKCSSYRN